jgi:hypothetical protein
MRYNSNFENVYKNYTICLSTKVYCLSDRLTRHDVYLYGCQFNLQMRIFVGLFHLRTQRREDGDGGKSPHEGGMEI